MLDTEKVMELATAVSEANARLDDADDMQKRAYSDACVAEEALLDYLGSVVTNVARDAEEEIFAETEAEALAADEEQDTALEATDAPSILEGLQEAVAFAKSEIIDATEEVTDEAVEASVESERAKTAYVEHDGAIAYGIMDSHGAENYPLDARDLYVEDCASYGIDPLPVPSSIAKPADVPVGEPDFGPRES